MLSWESGWKDAAHALVCREKCPEQDLAVCRGRRTARSRVASSVEKQEDEMLVGNGLVDS